MTYPFRRFLFPLYLILLSYPTIVWSSPWVDASDAKFRAQIQWLVDQKVLDNFTQSWPLSWAAISESIGRVDKLSLELDQASVLREVEFELKRQGQNSIKRELRLNVSKSRPLTRRYGSSFFERAEVTHNFEWDGDWLAVGIRSTLADDPGDDDYQAYFNGSFIAANIGNVVVGLGAREYWWGPGWQSSLILSNNARPIPSIFAESLKPVHFESTWLQWLGSFQWNTFLGQLESNRAIPEAKLWLMRGEFKPFSSLQIGFTRAMQFGGEGREENLGTLWDAFTSRSENSEDGAGNQLGGMDIRYSFSLPNASVAVYAQTIGEDEAGFLPTKRMYLFGFETSRYLGGKTLLHNFVEWADTTGSALDDDDPNTTYQHFLYQTGYRFRERVIGSSFDNDTRTLTFGSSLYKSNGDQLRLMVTYAQFNQDGSEGGNQVSATSVDAYLYESEWTTLVLNGMLTFGISYLTEDTATNFAEVDQANIYAGWTYRY